MRSLVALVTFSVLGCSIAACGLELGGIPSDLDAGDDTGVGQDGSAQGDGGGSDVQPIDDSGSPDGASVDSGPDAADAGPCSTPAGVCVASIPGGWALVAYESSRANGCPASYTQTDLVQDPQAQSGACDCGCNVTKQPVCDVGSIAFKVSGANCGSTGVTANVNGPSCQNLGAATVADHVLGNPIPPSGGTCTAPVLTNVNKVTTTDVRTCDVPAQCKEDVCNGMVPGGFSVCIEKSGTPACPAGWNANPAIIVGTSVNLACSSCSCQVNQTSTCTNASMSLWNNNSCTGGPDAVVVVDGQCDVPTGVNANVDHFKYSATLNTVCQASGAKTPTTLDVNAKATLCCK